jgi:hypothetical protein
VGYILPPVGRSTRAESQYAGNLAALPDNKTVVGVFPALNESKNGGSLYSTMFTMEVVDPATLSDGEYPPVKRVAPQLFYVSNCHESAGKHDC